MSPFTSRYSTLGAASVTARRVLLLPVWLEASVDSLPLSDLVLSDIEVVDF